MTIGLYFLATIVGFGLAYVISLGSSNLFYSLIQHTTREADTVRTNKGVVTGDSAVSVAEDAGIFEVEQAKVAGIADLYSRVKSLEESLAQAQASKAPEVRRSDGSAHSRPRTETS